jgi:hypothetical protein
MWRFIDRWITSPLDGRHGHLSPADTTLVDLMSSQFGPRRFTFLSGQSQSMTGLNNRIAEITGKVGRCVSYLQVFVNSFH